MGKLVLIEALRDIASERKTGMLFITLANGQNLMFGLDLGIVVAARSGKEDGHVVVDLLIQSPLKKVQFIAGPMTLPSKMQLSPAVLIRRLSGEQQRFSAEWGELIEKRLAQWIGPKARDICEDAFASSPMLLSDALELVVDRLEDARVAEKLALAFPEAVQQGGSITAVVGQVARRLPSASTAHQFPPMSAPPVFSRLSPARKQELVSLLGEAIGPIAIILCEAAINRHGDDRENLLQELVSSISGIEQQRAFLMAANRLFAERE